MPKSLTLKNPVPRTITIEGPDGKPIAGAKVTPRFVVFAIGDVRRGVDLHDALANSLAATTGDDGKVTFNFLARLDQLNGVYVTTRSTGRQYFPIDDGSMRTQWTTTTIRLKPTSRLAGSVTNAAGLGVSGQQVEIWSRAQPWEVASEVEFENGPVRTAVDGSFQTPDNLLEGRSYRAVIRAPGMEPVRSDWITIDAKPSVLRPFVLRPLASVNGRVVDRQGKPVAGIEVFQSGDGPERTTTVTDSAGRFCARRVLPGAGVSLCTRWELSIHGPADRARRHECHPRNCAIGRPGKACDAHAARPDPARRVASAWRGG